MVALTSAADTETASLDDYRLIRRLDHDPQGATFLAHDRVLDRSVTLTFLAGAPDAPSRLAGVRAFARVTHPNVRGVHRIVETAARSYVVSAFARGPRLDAVATPLHDARVLQIGRGLAGALAALHAAGASHGDVAAGWVVLSEEGEPQLFGVEHVRDADDTSRRQDVKALLVLLASIADHGLRAQLTTIAGHRGAPTAEQLRAALERLGQPANVCTSVDENPYRGLRMFEAEHADLFFGRHAEVAELVERLRTQPLLVIAGPSGGGKSSTARAGVGPAVAAGGLDERAVWDVATVVPGARPLDALASALAGPLGREAEELRASLRTDPGLAARLARSRVERGLLLVIDPLDEVLVLTDAAERDAFAQVVAHFEALVPGVRVLCTLRSDFLARLGELGSLGRHLLRAAFVLPPMSREGLREAVAAPARGRGFEFETPEMVDGLASEVMKDAQALPLLSFALAELWKERDPERKVLPQNALRRLGGAGPALARQGDLVFASLGRDERREARRLLLALLTAGETRVRRTAEELIAGGGAPAQNALAALVRGRFVVAGETCEIANDALVRAWPRLRAWLDEASDARATARRLTVAAREWDRLGRSAEALWGPRQLGDVDIAGVLGGMGEVPRAFVAESRAAVRRARWRWWGTRLGVPAAVLAVVAAVAGGVRWSERRRVHAFVAARVAEAEPKIQEVAALEAQVEASRARAFARYDARAWPTAEESWREALALARRESDALGAASAPIGLALARDPRDGGLRARAADLAYRWLLAAERDHEPDVTRDLLARLAQLDDDGSRRARLAAPARMIVTTSPPFGRVSLRPVRADADGHRVEGAERSVDPGVPLTLEPGSYLLSASAHGRYSTRYPLLLSRGEDARVEIPLPAEATIPRGFVFVPGGFSLLGMADVEEVRAALKAQPEHAVRVEPFLMSEREVTYGEYLEFLATLPPAERDARRPHGKLVDLTFDRDGAPALRLGQTIARAGEPLCRPKRSSRRCQDWKRFPVVRVSIGDARAYVAWLAAGRRPGARLCSEREWERAARGADGRSYPHADVLRPGEANFNETYAADDDQMGVDEVGSFPDDRSPFGVFDLGGNVAEWVGETFDGAAAVARGGDWRDETTFARAVTRHIRIGERYDTVGLRVCVPGS